VVSRGGSPGTDVRVRPSTDIEPAEDPWESEAETSPTAEEKLAGGHTDDTPASLISWVALAIAVPAALAVLVALLVYLLV
jgi:hypothetical protein